MFYDAVKNDHGLPLEPFYALVVPRPIAWISTRSLSGIANLAPYSFFNAFSVSPTYVAFGSEGEKDTLRNVRETGEFAVNMVTEELREVMNASSAVVAPEVDEFELAGVHKAKCQTIGAVRVAESPVCLECKLFQVIELPDDQQQVENHLVIGRVLGIHVDDRLIENGRVSTKAMQPIGRLGYSEYVTVRDAWRMKRPT